MLNQLESELAQVSHSAWVSALTLLALFHLALWLRRRRASEKAALALNDKTGAKSNRFIRSSHKREKDPKKRRTRIGLLGMGVVILAGLALSTNTSARFALTRLHMDAPWHVTVGLALEVIVVGLSLYAWAFQDKGATRVAYLLVFAQAVGAVEVVRYEGEDAGTALVRIVGPVMLAYGLHKMLGLEAKLGRIEIKSTGMLARAWRHFLSWLESYLGISQREADAEAIRRQRAQDKLVQLATLGKPRWWTQGKYNRTLMELGDRTFMGVSDPLDQLATEAFITARKDRAEAFKRLPERSEHYELHSPRPPRRAEGAPQQNADTGGALTSEGAPPSVTERGEDAPQATQRGAQARTGPAEDDAHLMYLAFELYCELRGAAGNPSQNAFEKEWRIRSYGLKTDDVRALYKRIDSKMSGGLKSE